MNCQNCESERILGISAKCNDLCSLDLDQDEYKGYVPYGLGIGGRDMIHISLCMNCGTIQGKWPNNSLLTNLTANC